MRDAALGEGDTTESIEPGAGEVFVRSAVKRRVVLSGHGDAASAEYVFCKHRGCSVPFSDCQVCRHVVSVPETADDVRTVVCQLESPKGADLAERSVLAERTFACVEGDTPFSALQSLFVDEAVTGVPVVDETGRPVGIVERSDFLRGCANERRRDGRPALVARDLMRPVPYTLREDAPLATVVALLSDPSTEHVPIVSSNGKITGLFSACDALRWLALETGYPTAR
jgi:CBS-domain-containing membrane protein